MIYLNKTCYNGLYRVNKSGGFNVPFGKFKNPTICDEQLIRDCSRQLREAGLVDGDFEYTVATAGTGDFVYFDPPYIPVSATATFTAYTSDGFTDADQLRLRDCALALKARGVFVMLSNSGSELSRHLYRDFSIHEVSAPRRINSNAAKRGDVTELIIT
jgi:DNA adenine methylase